jgi:Flp pilus assembly protein TadB
MEKSMRKILGVSSVVSAVAVTALAGWYVPAAIALVAVLAGLLIVWVLVDEDRTKRLTELIRAFFDRAA